MMQRICRKNCCAGYVALLSMLVLGTVASVVASTLLLNGVSASQTTLVFGQSKQALGLADACVEEVLQEIADSSSYTGTDTISLGQGSCTYSVIDEGGENRRIESTGTVADVVRKVQVEIDALTPSLSINAWQYVADF